MTDSSIRAEAPAAVTAPQATHARRALRWEASNAVLGKELRSRMRGARTYWIQAGYVSVVGLFVLAAYWSVSSLPTAGSGAEANRLAATVGRTIWTWGCVAQALLLPLIVPALTCGAITLERERDMLELLLLTQQSALQICVGKLAAGAGFGLMLVLSSLPVLALSALLGGVAPIEVAGCVAVLVSSVIAAAALGLAASSLAGRTRNAAVGAYGLVGTALFGVPALFSLLNAASSASMGATDAGIGLLLILYLLISSPLAIAAGFATAALLSRKRARPVERATRLAIDGAWWAVWLGLLYLPGVTDLLLTGQAVLLLHPFAAIAGAMSEPARRAPIVTSGGVIVGGSTLAIGPALPWLFTGVALFLACWFVLIAVLRVQRLRSG